MTPALQVRGGVAWIDYARRSMQRIGFLKWTLGLSSRAQTLESLTRTFAASVTKAVPVPPEQLGNFQKYIEEQHLYKQRYSNGITSAQVQDLYLADPALPSHSGAITGDLERKGYRHAVYVEMPTWAVRLRLLRNQNYTVTDRGRVLLESGSLAVESSIQSVEKNPFVLNTSERYVALFCILDADGDFLKGMYQRLLNARSFTRADAGEAGLQALVDLRSRMKNTSAGPVLQMRARVERTIEAIKKQSHSGLGPRESLATPRTEPLVDCGILCRPNPEKYEYTMTDWGRIFIESFVSDLPVDQFLETRFSAAMSKLTGHNIRSEMVTLEPIRAPYSRLRSGLGYVSLRELAVAVVSQALATGTDLFELETIQGALKQAAGSGTRYVRVAAGRTGGTFQVRIDARAFTE